MNQSTQRINLYQWIPTLILIVVLIAIIIFLTYSKSTQNQTEGLSETNPSMYIDEVFGFSFEVPANYYLFRQEIPEGAHGVIIQLGEKSGNLTIEDASLEIKYFDQDTSLELLKKNVEKDTPIRSSPINIDDQDGFRYESGGIAGQVYTAISTNGKSSIEIIGYDPERFDEIVSSFHFGI